MAGFLCQRYQPWAGIDDLFHIAILLGEGKSYGTFTPFFIEDLCDMCERLLTDLKRSGIVIPDNILKLSLRNISFHGAQMEKSLVVLCIPGSVRCRKHGVKFHGNESSVDHGIFGRTGMYINALEGYFCTAGVKVFVLDLAFRIAVQGICIIRTEFFYIKVGRSHADFFIRSKSDAERSVRYFFRKDMLQRSEDLCNAGLVVCAQDRGSV